jgi:outer membrane protein assembly factor BamB
VHSGLRSIALCLLASAPQVSPAQTVQKAQKPIVHDKSANRQIKRLELPGKKSEAVRRLLRMGKAATKDLTRALSDPRLEIVHTVAHILRMLGADAKAAVPALKKLAAGKDKERARVARWALAGVHPKGVILVSSSKGALVELDGNGKETFSLKQGNSLFDAERLANGNYLITIYTQRAVREITRKGRIVWEYKALKTPMDADRLPSGNTLISDITRGLIEVDPKGKIVWEFKTQSSYQAERLPNGNTLIPEYGGNRVIEVDPKGKIVWEFKGTNCMDADRLPNGNTLITLYSGKIQEVTSKGKVVFSIKAPTAYSAHRMQNGDILVVGNTGVQRFDKSGKELWFNKLGMAGSVEVY